MGKILILAALAEEADALFPDAASQRMHNIFEIRRLEYSGHDIEVAICGMGKVNASLAVGMLGADADFMLMSGTCAAIGAAPRSVYWLSEAVQHDYGAVNHGTFDRYRAGDWPMGKADAVHFSAMPDPGMGLAHARIASGDSFVACPEAAAGLKTSLGATLVDMEVGALAQAAARLARPWAAIKAVTDDANGDSGGDFKVNLVRAARQAAGEVERLVTML